MTLGETLWVIVKFIASVVWTAVRICFIIVLALFLGAMRGAARTKDKSGSSRD